jgi:DNA-binding transcriptional ArsR family regulator
MAEVASLVGDPARANILCALLDGRALTAGELAFAAGVSPQTTSGHLAKLHDARLIDLCKQGRHRYYRLAGSHVGQMLEWTIFFTRPIALVLIIIGAVLLAWSAFAFVRKRRDWRSELAEVEASE